MKGGCGRYDRQGGEGENGGTDGVGTGTGCGKDRLTRIFLFVISLAACAVGKAQMCGFAVVVALAAHGDVQGT